MRVQRSRDALAECAGLYAEAAVLAARGDTVMASRYHTRAAADLTTLGRFREAAAVQHALSELHEGEGNFPAAGEARYYAAELLLTGDLWHDAARCYHDAGRHYLRGSEWVRARLAFEHAARTARTVNMARHRVCDCYLDACIATLGSGHVTEAEGAALGYAAESPAFCASPHRRFVFDVIACAKAVDVDGFVDRVWNWDGLHPLAHEQLG